MIGLQLYSVRDEIEKDLYGTLRAIKEMGYDGVELCGLYGKTPDELRAMLDELGLEAFGAHVGLAELMGDTERVVNDYIAVGCKNITIPWLPEENRPTGENFAKTVRDIAEIAKKISKMPITMSYHNHEFEFEKFGGGYALDYIYATIPAEHLKAEIDAGWVSNFGLNAVEYIRKYKGRLPLVHLKDFTGKLFTDDYEFRPIGYGDLDIKSICNTALDECGTEWLIVEQDLPTPNKTSLECAAMSAAFLRELINNR